MSSFLPWNCCKPADAYGYDFEQGPAEQARMPPRAELDIQACQPKEKPVFGRGEEKVDDQVKQEREDARLIEHDAVAQAQVIGCPHLCEQTCDCCKANHDARQANLEKAGLIPSAATSYTSCFPSCFSSSSAPAPAKAEGETSGGWSMGNIMGNSKEAAEPGVWSYRSRPLDKMKAASFFRAVDMSDVTTNMEVFRTVSRVSSKEVADRLIDEGCSARIAEMFVEKEIDGDTLHTLRVEDLIRDWGLERYVAEGLYNKIRRILGTTIGGELVQIHNVDSQPTSKSLVRLVRQQHEHRYSSNYLGMALGEEAGFSGPASRKAGEQQETTAGRDREGSLDAGNSTFGADEVKTSDADADHEAAGGCGLFSCAVTAPALPSLPSVDFQVSVKTSDDIDANPRMGEATPAQQTMTPMTPTQQMQHMQNQMRFEQMQRMSTMQGMGTIGMQQQWPMQQMNHQGGGMNNISQQATQQMGQPSQMPETVTLRVESLGSETPAGPNNQL